jgi:hypothetical protein
MQERINPFDQNTNKKGINKSKQQGNKNNWKNAQLSILTLNVNGHNAITKRHRKANRVEKQNLTICCLQWTHLIEKNKYWLTVKWWKKIFQANRPINREE